MRKFSRLYGLSAVDGDSGRTLGRVEMLCLASNGQQAEGFLLAVPGLLKKSRYVPYAAVLLFGEHTLTIRRTSSSGKAPKSQTPLLGQPVRDTLGQLLGWVTDGYLEEETGQVCGIEVSFGLLEDFTQGRQLFSDFILLPGGVVVVPGEALKGQLGKEQ